MKAPTFRLDHIRIASPCPVAWDQMTGDERVRRCDLCELHVYDISRMTSREAESLIANSEGRICARLFRRADGTVITRDCPVGLRAIKRRVAKTAGAVLAAIMTLCASVAGQHPSSKDKDSCASQVRVTRRVSESQGQAGAITLKILDVNGAVVAGADVTVQETINPQPGSVEKKRGRALTSSDEGRVEVHGLAKGFYDLIIESPGFKSFSLTNVEVKAKEVVSVEVTLTVSEPMTTIGIVATDLLIEAPRGGNVIDGPTLRRLPIGK